MKTKVVGVVVSATVAMAGLTGSAMAAPAQTPAEILQAGAQAGVNDGYPGVIGLVRDGDSTQYIHAGYGDPITLAPADPKAQFRIGSDTKAFTATVLLQLEAEGRLSLDDTVARWLPGVVNANGNDGTRITIRELLDQTSGLPDYDTDPGFLASYYADLNPSLPWTPQNLVDIATSYPSLSAPGQEFHYSNTNYVLAGMVIRAVTGDDPAVEIQRRIIEPLGLSNTTFPTADPNLYGNFLHGYASLVGLAYRDVTVSDVQAFGTAGAIVSTEDDLATFERALLSGALLPSRQETELKTTVPADSTGDRYGLGLVLSPTACGMVWNHNGEVLGYYNEWLTSDDGSKQVLIAANENRLVDGTPGQTALGAAASEAYCAP